MDRPLPDVNDGGHVSLERPFMCRVMTMRNPKQILIREVVFLAMVYCPQL
uniref:Uncharacterized protein n=1 Tax=Arundo donax TaxID=35708 RepID=A0A0A9QXF8_ARUDO